MKKLIAISILLVLLSVSAFAQFTVAFSSKFWTDAVFFRGATGDMADADSVKGVFDVFAGNQTKGNEVRLNFSYKGEGFSGALQWKLDDMFKRNGKDQNAGGGTNYQATVDPSNTTNIRNGAPSTGFFGSGASFNDLLGLGLGDWNVQNTTGLFRGYAGNGGNTGAVGGMGYNKAGDWGPVTYGDYGVVKFPFLPHYGALNDGLPPTAGSGFSNMVGRLKGVNNLRNGSQMVSLTLMLGELGLPDIRVAIGTDTLFSGWGNSIPIHSYGEDAAAPNVPATSASAIAGAFRISGYKVADFISFDLIYRINGNDPNTRLTFNNGIADPLGNTASPAAGSIRGGAWTHDIGVYAGFAPIPGLLDIGAGVSATFDDVEKTRVGDADPVKASNSATVEYVKPLFLGFDLHLKLTLSPEIQIGLSNNLSLASQRGENGLSDDTGGRFIQPMGYLLPGFGNIAGDGRNGAKPVPGIGTFISYFQDKKNPDKQDNVYLASAPSGLAGRGFDGNMTNTDTTDSWFALYNTLSLQFKLNPKVTLNASVANKLGVYEFIGVPLKEFAKYTTDNIGFGVGADYALSGNVKFGAGLNVDIWSMTADITTTTRNADGSEVNQPVGTFNPTLTTGKIGQVQFVIPIRFGVSW